MNRIKLEKDLLELHIYRLKDRVDYLDNLVALRDRRIKQLEWNCKAFEKEISNLKYEAKI